MTELYKILQFSSYYWSCQFRWTSCYLPAHSVL